MEEVDIRLASINDIDSLLTIEETCFLAPWKRKDIEYELKDNPVATILVITVNNLVAGFLDYWITFDSSTVAQIAVSERYRKNHLASKLLDEMMLDLYAKKVLTSTLEVRENNHAAISLYNKYGYKTITVKPNYYTNGDNALYMLREVGL